MSRKLIEYTEIAPGMVRIESKIDGLFTLDRYVSLARDLLEHGAEITSNEKLKDMDTPELIDNMLLYQEIEKKVESKIKEVSFNFNGKNYMVNLKNINKIKPQKMPETSHLRAIRDAIEESMERA